MKKQQTLDELLEISKEKIQQSISGQQNKTHFFHILPRVMPPAPLPALPPALPREYNIINKKI